MAAIFSGYFALGFVYLRGGRNMRNGYLDIWILLAIACLAACITCIITCKLNSINSNYLIL